MALKNLSNYRIGQSYYFYVGETKKENIHRVLVVDKGYFKMKLRLEDGCEDWYEATELSPVEKWLRLQDKKANYVEVKVEEKPAAKIDPTKEEKQPEIVEKISIKEPIVSSKVVIDTTKKVEVTSFKNDPSPTEHKEILNENISDDAYVLKRFKRQIRWILKHKFDVELAQTCSLQQVLDALTSLPD